MQSGCHSHPRLANDRAAVALAVAALDPAGVGRRGVVSLRLLAAEAGTLCAAYCLLGVYRCPCVCACVQIFNAKCLSRSSLLFAPPIPRCSLPQLREWALL